MSRFAETGAPARLFHPRSDAWDDHFAWSAQDWGILEGKTPVGRATVERLQMNAPQLVTTRRFLVALGVAPQRGRLTAATCRN